VRGFTPMLLRHEAARRDVIDGNNVVAVSNVSSEMGSPKKNGWIRARERRCAAIISIPSG